MSGAFLMGLAIPVMLRTLDEPVSNVRGAIYGGYLTPYENLRLPGDSVATMTLTLTNVVPGSICDIEVATTGVPVVTPVVASGAQVQFQIPVYPSGNVKNNLRIKVGKGTSAPYYQRYETQVTAASGSQSIFINQLSDE